jgi:integrase
MARPRLATPNYRLVKRGTRFYVRWWEGGSWQRVSTGQTERRQAEIWLAQFVAGRETPPAPAVPTISAILDGYLADRKQVVRRYDTLENASKSLKRHLGDLEPDHLTKERVRFYRRRRAIEGYEVGPATARRRKPVKDGTILRELVMLRAALKWAQHEKWITEVPYIEVPSQPPPRDRWLARHEADRLIEAAQAPHIKIFLSVCLWTAARPGAVLELTWDKVDLNAGRIDLGAVPGGKGRAIIPIGQKLLPLLEEARQIATCSYVIEHGSKPVGSVKTGTRAAARRAGLHGVTPHVLRHTGATWRAIAGVPLDQIGRLPGHSVPAAPDRKWQSAQGSDQSSPSSPPPISLEEGGLGARGIMRHNTALLRFIEVTAGNRDIREGEMADGYSRNTPQQQPGCHLLGDPVAVGGSGNGAEVAPDKGGEHTKNKTDGNGLRILSMSCQDFEPCARNGLCSQFHLGRWSSLWQTGVGRARRRAHWWTGVLARTVE